MTAIMPGSSANFDQIVDKVAVSCNKIISWGEKKQLSVFVFTQLTFSVCLSLYGWHCLAHIHLLCESWQPTCPFLRLFYKVSVNDSLLSSSFSSLILFLFWTFKHTHTVLFIHFVMLPASLSLKQRHNAVFCQLWGVKGSQAVYVQDDWFLYI